LFSLGLSFREIASHVRRQFAIRCSLILETRTKGLNERFEGEVVLVLEACFVARVLVVELSRNEPGSRLLGRYRLLYVMRVQESE
jgi:hypothetical protein